ncbi:response regulator [soil metagenome]
MPRILLVEDDSTLSEMYELMLKMKGHDVTLSRNGQDALERAAALKPEVILLDMMMPVLNGIETLKQLKANPVLRAIPVAMLSNLADDQQAALALTTGATKYVIKSDCNSDTLNELVFAMLGTSPEPPTQQTI